MLSACFDDDDDDDGSAIVLIVFIINMLGCSNSNTFFPETGKGLNILNENFYL